METRQAAAFHASSWVLAGCVALSGIAGAAPPASTALVALEPVMVEGRVLTRSEADGTHQAPVVRALAGALATALAREARSGATAFVLQLDAAAQGLQGRAHPQPTYLLVSEEEGGFARHGFWLARPATTPEWHDEPYVNLVVDADSVADGSFEEIFAHEAGHVLLRRLLPSLPSGYSRLPHSSLAITDYPTAFDEGFAIHFQALARQLTHNARLRRADAGFGSQPFVPYWRDAFDRGLRIRGVRDNLFVQRQLPSARAAAASPDATTLFDAGELKSGQQMMASEGVIATLFYHLLDEPAADRAVLLGRYLQLMRALHALNPQATDPSSPVFVRLVQEHIRLFPESRAAWLNTVVGLTYGATVDLHLAQQAGELARLGLNGEAQQFVAQLTAARQALRQCVAAVMREPQRLGEALGPEVWAAVEAAPQPAAAAAPGDPGLAAVNVNTAERGSLMLWLKLDAATAERALASRAALGPFSDLGDFARRAALGAEQEAQLRSGAARLIAAGPFARE
jgi:DNA uptake protein ComE-like DNA-binding protein